ncbi:MAG: sialidase family protein [Actinomycetota bacterium]
MSRSKSVWSAALPLLLVLVIAISIGAAMGSVSLAGTARSAATDALRGAPALGQVTTQSLASEVATQAFAEGRPTFNVTSSFDGLGILAVNRQGVLYAIQRRGASSIDPSGHVELFQFQGAQGGWASRTIYTSQWDNRNIAGGITPKGTIIVFFGRYDANTGRWVDLGFIRSTDDGQTFGPYTTLPIDGGDAWFSPYGPLLVFPSGRLMQLFYGNNGYEYRLRALFSDDDGLTWQHESVIDRQSYERPTEATGFIIPGTRDSNSKIVVVSRTEPGPNPRARGGLCEYVSSNGGTTWKRLGFLNVGTSPSDISPWLAQLQNNRVALVWADRASMTIQVSISDQSAIAANELAWRQPYTLYTSRLANQRPRQAANFGYPSVAHIGTSDTDAVVVFFDANASDPSIFREQARANTDLVLIRLLGPSIYAQYRQQHPHASK